MSVMSDVLVKRAVTVFTSKKLTVNELTYSSQLYNKRPPLTNATTPLQRKYN